MKVLAWRISGPDWRSDIFLPPIAADMCEALYPSGFNVVCTRAAGHGGRHAAAISSGEVAAVWGDA